MIVAQLRPCLESWNKCVFPYLRYSRTIAETDVILRLSLNHCIHSACSAGMSIYCSTHIIVQYSMNVVTKVKKQLYVLAAFLANL